MSLRLGLLVLIAALWPSLASEEGGGRVTIGAVLREPVPPEELKLSSEGGEYIVAGPTFTYRVEKQTGVIRALRVVSVGEEVVSSCGPAQLRIDDFELAAELSGGGIEAASAKGGKIVLEGRGIVRGRLGSGPVLAYAVKHTFFSDGVVVSSVKLTPRERLVVEKSLVFQLEAQGPFSHYLHKRRDEHGDGAVRGPLPKAGGVAGHSGLTSCLQVFSPKAALAVFTDRGALHLSRTNLETAAVNVIGRVPQRTRVSLSQSLVQVAPGDPPYVVQAGQELSFRVGISVAPCRLPQRRSQDLRMFAWVGDARYPYPTDGEIEEAAKLGYTLFQMHRLGTPGEPRPPAGELERVIRKVHELGMLFLWTENADLMYDSAPGVQELKAKGQWQLWQGFNYGGRYRASMDPYCDLAATCLASPNGLAEYRLATIARMMDSYAVDGIYLDDNLAYPGCTLWREHGHPSPVYDCLIELHEMNWQRRQLMRQKCPHLVLVSHNTRAMILPMMCDFDAILYGEGYSFGSPENYWDYYRMVNSLPAQGMIWPGGQDRVRCAAAVAYNYDLLTGGGQYCYIDWRLFPKKFPYGAGVTDTERLYVQTYNAAQYYFGMYESKPHCFADSTETFGTTGPQTYATVYQSQVWGDLLVAIANMSGKAQETSLQVHAPQVLGLAADARMVLFDVHRRTMRRLAGRDLSQALNAITLPAEGLELFYVRPVPARGAFHVWGGKRLSETWDEGRQTLTLRIQGPPGLEDTLFLASAGTDGVEVMVDGRRKAFYVDPTQGVIHGKVVFGAQPVKVEVLRSGAGGQELPQWPVPASPLVRRPLMYQ